MTKDVRVIYWETSVFLCFLSKGELARRAICEETLREARDGKIKLITSMITMVEVIRPKGVPHPLALTADEQSKIEGMFKWPWLRKIQVHEKVAAKAVELARIYKLKPMDSIHAATAVLSGVDEFHKWDRDYSKVASLLNIVEPYRISPQPTLIDVHKPIAPLPDEFSSDPSGI